MLGRGERIAFWLTPAAPERHFFAQLIEMLADRFSAPNFEPHITLHGDCTDFDQACRALVSAGQKPLRLQIEGVSVSDSHTKTLFVRFRSASEAVALVKALHAACPPVRRSDFDPHLSLLYKDLDADARAHLAREIEIPFQEVLCDTIKMVAHPEEIRQRADVEAWRMLGERRFAAA